MRIIYNRWLPIKGYSAMNFFGVLLARHGQVITNKTVRHERIHTAQMKELGYIFFYVWYIIEWLIRLPFGKAYYNISFEREAYENEDNIDYLSNRKFCSFLKYM